MSTPLSRDEAVAEVHRWREQVARWQAETLAAEVEGQSLRARMGEEILADPEQMESLTSALRETAARAEAARSAAAAAIPKVEASTRAVLEIDAATFEMEAEEARHALVDHERRVGNLLEKLENLEGKHEPMRLVDYQTGMAVGYVELRSVALKRSLAQVELKAAVLRDRISGIDPDERLSPLMSTSDGTVLGLPRADYYDPMAWVDAAERLEEAIGAKKHEIEAVDAEMDDFDPSATIAKNEHQIAEWLELERKPSNSYPYRRDIEELREAVEYLSGRRATQAALRARLVTELDELVGRRDHEKIEV